MPYRAMIEVKPMRKFKIPNIPATEPKSIRFPVDVISEVEHTIRGKGAAFFLPLGQGKRKDAPEGVPSKGKNMKKKTAWVG